MRALILKYCIAISGLASLIGICGGWAAMLGAGKPAAMVFLGAISFHAAFTPLVWVLSRRAV